MTRFLQLLIPVLATLVLTTACNATPEVRETASPPVATPPATVEAVDRTQVELVDAPDTEPTDTEPVEEPGPVVVEDEGRASESSEAGSVELALTDEECPAGLQEQRDDPSTTLQGWRGEAANEVALIQRRFGGPVLEYEVVLADSSLFDLGSHSGAATFYETYIEDEERLEDALGETPPPSDEYLARDARGSDLSDSDQREIGLSIERMIACFGLRSCFIVINQPGLTGSARRAVIAHELFHCWAFGRLYGVSEVYFRLPIWVSEGLAGWYGETRGNSGFADEWWDHFFGVAESEPSRFDLFDSTYSAIGFWSHVAKDDTLIDRIPAIIDAGITGSDIAVFEAATTIGRDSLAASPTQSHDLGSEWMLSGPNMSPDSRRPFAQRTVTASEPLSLSVGTGIQQAFEIDFDLAGGDNWLIATTVRNNGGSRWADGTGGGFIGDGNLVETRCVGVCECPEAGEDDSPGPHRAGRTDLPPEITEIEVDGEPLTPENAVLFVALSGGINAAEAEVSLQAVDKECDQNNRPEGESGDGRGLIGTWVADPAAVRAIFVHAYKDLTVTSVTGTVTMTLTEDKRASLNFANVSVQIEGPLPPVITNGSGTMNWDVIDGRFTVYGWARLSVSTKIVGVDEAITVTEADLGSSPAGNASFSTTIFEDRLVLADQYGSELNGFDVPFFPYTWQRAR